MDRTFLIYSMISVHYLVGLAKDMVRDYFNLNIAEQASCYHGPISIIRRDHDEMMTMYVECPMDVDNIYCMFVILFSDNGDLSSNRGNYLLIKILQTRSRPSITIDRSYAPCIHTCVGILIYVGQSVW